MNAIDDIDLYWWPFPDAAAFAKLRSLTKLALAFDEEDGFFGRHSERTGALDGLGGAESLVRPMSFLTIRRSCCCARRPGAAQGSAVTCTATLQPMHT